MIGHDLRVHLVFSGIPACGAGDEPSEVSRMLTATPEAVTCAACLASAFFDHEVQSVERSPFTRMWVAS